MLLLIDSRPGMLINRIPGPFEQLLRSCAGLVSSASPPYLSSSHRSSSGGSCSRRGLRLSLLEVSGVCVCVCVCVCV